MHRLGASLEVTPAELDFGVVAVGVVERRSVFLTSVGDLALGLTGLEVIGEDSASFSAEGPVPTVIELDRSSSLTLQFAPRSMGTFRPL